MDKISKEKLEKVVSNLSTFKEVVFILGYDNKNSKKCGRKYSVSDNAVRKWLKTYEKNICEVEK